MEQIRFGYGDVLAPTWVASSDEAHRRAEETARSTGDACAVVTGDPTAEDGAPEIVGFYRTDGTWRPVGSES